MWEISSWWVQFCFQYVVNKVFCQIWRPHYCPGPGSGGTSTLPLLCPSGYHQTSRHSTYLKRLVWPVLRFITGFNKPLIVINLTFLIIHSSKVSLVLKILILSILKEQKENNFLFLRSHEETITTLNNTNRKKWWSAMTGNLAYYQVNVLPRWGFKSVSGDEANIRICKLTTTNLQVGKHPWSKHPPIT